jgi:hypothetical protein
MALLSSHYWSSMSAGRLAWALCSGLVPSALPALLLNHALCLLAGFLYTGTSERTLYAATISLGVGVSSVFPALLTLPPEAGVPVTPSRMATLQLMGSAGEMLCPFFVGVLFQLRLYSWFGPLIAGSQAVSLLALAAAWSVVRHGRGERPGGDYARVATTDDRAAQEGGRSVVRI